ncbi:hypothetical protein LA66_06745 [Aureimonas altamirensis]|uniref:Uncharacterized protein n=1 Tax=Aureimonas altamirensis TaxID=370622 RepID=A0A0B1QBS0_9HYPH|nr:hypothetical protein [Aureimonas altamirensis]KHJ56265.1 hypothetical protein LA66_06745 [Aureimonas altamirensis]
MTTRTVSPELTPAQRQAFEEAVERYGKSFFANPDLIWKTLLGASESGLREAEFMRADLATIEAHLERSTPETDPVGHRQFTRRAEELRAALSAAPKGGA